MSRGADLLARFVAEAAPPRAALARAASAVRDTVGVTLAGAVEPAARAVQAMAMEEGRGRSVVLGAAGRTGASWAAMANGVAAHALDFDDMCFVSLAHPSCALFPAALAAAELAHASGRALLEGYVVGFELECRLGKVMNPRHYHERGWHCTSTIGTVGAAAAAARVLSLSPGACGHAIGIAASSACGLKENLGSMVKPLHAGMAARNGVVAARLAQRGYVASERALDGPQGFLAAMDAEQRDLDAAVTGLGGSAASDDGAGPAPRTPEYWEILATGITVKLYPSCAATHPALDALLDLRARERVAPDEVEAIDVEVDSMTPRLLIYDRPSTGLEGKFSMPYCAAAAIVDGHVGIATFERARLEAPAIRTLLPTVTMRVNAAFDATAPLSHARVTLRLRGGRVLTQAADGARGYPSRPASDAELRAKFVSCACRSVAAADADRAWEALARLEDVDDVSALAERLAPALETSVS
ncbi:MAG: MmgE/PrpD family protein [Acidobacteria bacterium]|nr:MmgE/PrpD family protein [Acidobacteriota bacterium]